MIDKNRKNNIEEITKKYELEHKDSDQVSDTIYDDVIRSICERFLWMLIPLVNHTLGTNYSREAKIRLLPNEHHNVISNKMDTRVTDAYFEIEECGVVKQYHLECQSNSDASMIVRIMEYDFMIAIDEMIRNLDDHKYECELRLPETVVLYLRHQEGVPKYFKVRMRHNEQEMLYKARIVNAQDYSLTEIEDAELYVLVPYYLMRYEEEIKNNKNISYVEQEIEHIIHVIQKALDAGKINAYVADLLQTYAQRILLKIAQKSASRERLVEKMSGQVIVTLSDVLYEAGQKDGLSQGFSQGISQGLSQGISQGIGQGLSQGLQALVNSLKEYVTTPEEMLEKVRKNQQYKDVTLEEIKKYFEE